MVGPIVEQHRAERDDIGKRLMTALLDAMPFGMQVDLGNGSNATFTGINGREARVYQKPIYREGAPWAKEDIDPEKDIVGHEEWQFICDWRLKNCDQDHIEVTIKITGGGGFV